MDLTLLQVGLVAMLVSSLLLVLADFMETDVRHAFLATLLQSGAPVEAMDLLDRLPSRVRVPRRSTALSRSPSSNVVCNVAAWSPSVIRTASTLVECGHVVTLGRVMICAGKSDEMLYDS